MKPQSASRLALPAAALLLCATSAGWAAEGIQSQAAPLAATSWEMPDRDFTFLTGAPVRFSGLEGSDGVQLDLGSAGYDARAMLADAQRQAARPSLLKLYRDALMTETRRSMRRDPSLFWVESFDDAVGANIHEGIPMNRMRKSAEKIFGEAHQELLAGALNHLIETSEPLSALNRKIRGIDFRVRADASRSDILPFDGETSSRSDRRDDTNVSFVVSNHPRLAMETRLGRIKTSVELPLLSPGIRTTFSTSFTSTMRGTLSMGVEDMGEDYWVSAGLRCGF